MERPIWEEELENFLAGTFHQDMGSPDEALEEYITKAGEEWGAYMCSVIESFLSCDMSEEERKSFIENNTYIYFPAIGKQPIEWLTNVLQRMKNT